MADHDHAHHDHAHHHHAHHHHHPGQGHPPASALPSLLRLSALERLAVVAGVAALLWLVTFWSVS